MASEKLYGTHLKPIKIEEIVIFMIKGGYNDPSKCKCWKLFRAILRTFALIVSAHPTAHAVGKFRVENFRANVLKHHFHCSLGF